MDDQQWLSERFEEYRSRLRAVAYRMLGSLRRWSNGAPMEKFAPVAQRVIT